MRAQAALSARNLAAHRVVPETRNSPLVQFDERNVAGFEATRAHLLPLRQLRRDQATRGVVRITQRAVCAMLRDDPATGIAFKADFIRPDTEKLTFPSRFTAHAFQRFARPI